VRARDAQDVGRLLRGQHRAGRNQRDRTARCDTVQEIEHQVGDRGFQANGLAVFAVNGEDAVPGTRAGKRRYRLRCARNLLLRRKTVCEVHRAGSAAHPDPPLLRCPRVSIVAPVPAAK